jgi:NAD-dependent SIR2 family protein deacetylase
MTERHRLDELLPLPLHLDSRVLVLTGAGVSAESGVPTFRDAGGLWNSHPVEKVASPEGFADDPALVWRFYAERRRDAGSVSPNPGHRALAALERTLGPRFLLVTQNVDDLHHKAGSEHPLEIHGNLFVTRCSVCTRRPFRDERAYAEPPLCDACAAQGKRSYLRPHIVWFASMPICSFFGIAPSAIFSSTADGEHAAGATRGGCDRCCGRRCRPRCSAWRSSPRGRRSSVASMRWLCRAGGSTSAVELEARDVAERRSGRSAGTAPSSCGRAAPA